jgi:DnaJ-class molecular chaperone
MPEPGERHCPNCNGIGLARAVSSIPGRPLVMNVKMVCETCHHEWTVEQRDRVERARKTA